MGWRGALLFGEKISQRDAVFRFGWRDDGIFQVFYSRAILQRITVDSSAFLEPGLAEKIAVCAHTTRLPKKKEV
jgi:hypothetical protein